MPSKRIVKSEKIGQPSSRDMGDGLDVLRRARTDTFSAGKHQIDYWVDVNHRGIE